VFCYLHIRWTIVVLNNWVPNTMRNSFWSAGLIFGIEFGSNWKWLILTQFPRLKTKYPSQLTPPKCASITLKNFQDLPSKLNLNDMFNTAVFAIATIAFWCQCHINKVCVDCTFDATIQTTWYTSKIWLDCLKHSIPLILGTSDKDQTAWQIYYVDGFGLQL